MGISLRLHYGAAALMALALSGCVGREVTVTEPFESYVVYPSTAGGSATPQTVRPQSAQPLPAAALGYSLSRREGREELADGAASFPDGTVVQIKSRSFPVQVTARLTRDLNPGELNAMRGQAIYCPRGAVSNLREEIRGSNWIFNYNCLLT